MTIRHQDKNVSAEIDLTTLFDIEIEPANALSTGETITGVKLTRRDFHDEEDGTPEWIDLMDIFYTEQEIDERVKIYIDIYQSYSELPEVGKSNHIYLIPFTSPTDTKEGIFKEYLWTTQNKYEVVGSTEIDLTDMQLKSNISTFFPSSDSALSDTKYPSERLVKLSLNGKVDKRQGYDLSKNDFTDNYKTKLDRIEPEANKTIVDSAINSNSTNPVENRAINTELNKKVDKVAGKQLSTNDFTNNYKIKVDNISTVGITNNYNDLDNKPTIPQKTSDLVNDSEFVTSVQVTEQLGAVDVIQNGNPNPASSNAVYDHSNEVIDAMTDEINGTASYILEDDIQRIEVDLLELLDNLAIEIREAGEDDSSD